MWDIVDWIYLIEDRNQWQALVNMLMNTFSSIKGGEFLDWVNVSF
jgi:hypothetical protein